MKLLLFWQVLYHQQIVTMVATIHRVLSALGNKATHTIVFEHSPIDPFVIPTALVEPSESDPHRKWWNMFYFYVALLGTDIYHLVPLLPLPRLLPICRKASLQTLYKGKVQTIQIYFIGTVILKRKFCICLFVQMFAPCRDTLGSWWDQAWRKCSSQALKAYKYADHVVFENNR